MTHIIISGWAEFLGMNFQKFKKLHQVFLHEKSIFFSIANFQMFDNNHIG